MKRKYFLGSTVAILAAAIVVAGIPPQFGFAQPTGMQPEAQQLLRRMGDYLASQQKFAVNTENSIEVVLKSGQKIQFDGPATAIVSRPNKLRAHRRTDLFNQEFIYDGKSLTLFNPKEKLYATTAAPGTVEEMLDFAREKLDIVAPASEFLYKNSAEKMLKEATSGFVVGQSVVAGVKCTQLAFRSDEFDWQVWVEDGARPLPRKFILTSKKVAGEPQMTVLVKSWDLAPKIGAGEFTFTTPKDAKKIDFLLLTSGSAKGK
jgi:hypothetical protein